MPSPIITRLFGDHPAGTALGVLTASDPDASDTVILALMDDAGGRFALAADGVTLVTTQAIDFEGEPALVDDVHPSLLSPASNGAVTSQA